MISHDCIGYYLLSEEVSKRVKVIQTGQGAEKIFAGYHWYRPLMESSNPVRIIDRGVILWGVLLKNEERK